MYSRRIMRDRFSPPLLQALRHFEIGQSPSGEIIHQPVNSNVITITPGLLDRLGPDEVLDLFLHALLHQERNCILLFQGLDFERSGEVGERRYPASEGVGCRLGRRTGCSDAGNGTAAISVPNDGHWEKSFYHPPSGSQRHSGPTVLHSEVTNGISYDRQHTVIVRVYLAVTGPNA